MLLSSVCLALLFLQENHQLSKEYGDMKACLSKREADNRRLEDLLGRLQEEKKRLTQRNNKLTVNGMCVGVCVLMSLLLV